MSDDVYLKPGEVASIFSVSAKTVSRWAKDGRLPFITTLGGHRRFPESAVRQLAADVETWADGEDQP
jgi:excisionase family DNA binding protein